MALKGFGKSFVLILIIIILVIGGLLWFDYLGIVRVKNVFSPVYKLMGKMCRQPKPPPNQNPLLQILTKTD